jgi:hypothetical protein
MGEHCSGILIRLWAQLLSTATATKILNLIKNCTFRILRIGVGKLGHQGQSLLSVSGIRIGSKEIARNNQSDDDVFNQSSDPGNRKNGSEQAKEDRHGEEEPDGSGRPAHFLAKR